MRKTNGYSQEGLAEKIGGSRQTISNWELGSTTPNKEQLLSLSKIFKVSVDELLDNELNYINKNSRYNHIFIGSMLIGGSIASIWSFTANRFRYSEMLFIIMGGIILGYGIGLVINEIVKRLEYKNAKKNKINI